jgi:hypothetical protein
LIAAAGLRAVVVSRIERAVFDHQLTMEQIQLFDAGMDVRRIGGSGGEPYQHGHSVLRPIRRK